MICKVCNQELDESDFYTSNKNTCKLCLISKQKVWNRANKSRLSAYGVKYRATHTVNPGLDRRIARVTSLPVEEISKLDTWTEHDGVCYVCFRRTSIDEGEQDHLIGYAMADCPGHVWENLAWSCFECNRTKPKKYQFAPATSVYLFKKRRRANA